MKKKAAKFTAVIVAAAMALPLAACGSGSSGSTSADTSASGTEEAASDSGEIVTVNLTMPTVYDLPDQDKVEEAINEITGPKYGINFDLQFISTGNWQQQSSLLFTGDEADIIAVFMSPLTTYVRNGQLTDLTDYYANASDAFKEVIPEDTVNGTTVNGKVYAITNLRNYGNIVGLNIDSDIAEEYGIESGQKLTMEDVDTFLEWCHEHYPDRYGLVPQSGSTMTSTWSWDGLGDETYIGVLPDCGQDTTVQNLFDTDDFRDFCNWTRKWYQAGYTMQDVLSNTTPFQTLVANDQAIAAFDNYSVNNIAGITRTVIIDAWAQSNSYQALCYGINQNSSKKDDAWKAMEILYTDADVETLLTDGIEGLDYTKNDDGTISFVDGKAAGDTGYGMAEGYWITPWSGDTFPLDVNGPTFFDDLKTFNENTLKTKAFGFVFDTSNVTDQYAACVNVMTKYRDALMSGSVDPDSTIEQANEEFEAAGLADVIAEKQSQLDAFLAQ